MKNLKLLLSFLVLFGLMTSCQKEDKLNPISVFVDSDIKKNDLDNYIEREYTKPFNIGLLYKYLDIESDMNYNLSPANYESSVRLTKLIKYLAIEPYNSVTGSASFIKNNFPKLMNFIGSPAYKNNGTMVIGTAEGGRKITMYNVNAITPTRSKDRNFLNEMFFHTIHHEFGHILHQTKPYSTTFKEISDRDYVTDSWNTEFPSTKSAIIMGFISSYASSEVDDDFVEIFSYYITLTPAEWNTRVNLGVTGATGAALTEATAGRNRLLAKLDILQNYFRSSWGIEINELRDEVLRRLDGLMDFDQTSLN